MKHEKLNNQETSQLGMGSVSDCCSSSNNVSKVYLLDFNDCVFENGVIVRTKRKYGKRKRVVRVIYYNNR